MALTAEQQAYCQRIANAAPAPTPEVAARLAALLPPAQAPEARAS